VRRLIAATALAACAQPGLPPGGPPDREPPQVARIVPDTNAVNVRRNSIAFDFNEVVSERPQGPRSLAEAFIVSPSFGPLEISWRRTRIEVTPHGGLRPNTTYTVELLPGITDLATNVDSAGARVVFSTGPSIARGVIGGRVFDWVAARPAPNAFVEAVLLPDSATYATTADSLGAFTIEHVPAGTYLLRALVDQNRNRLLDPRELFDSATIALADTFRRNMLAAVRDSLGPGIATVEARDSIWLRIALDRPLDTLFVPGPANIVVKHADSTQAEVAEVITQAEYDGRVADSARARAVEDSVRRAEAADSIRAADSTRAAASGAAVAAPPRPTGRRPGAPTRPPLTPVRDSITQERPRPEAQLPVTAIHVRLARALNPDTAYRVRTEDLVSVTGAVRSSERVFTSPRRAVQPDTAAPPDTGRGKRD
jgi:hypothetical protein